MSRNRAVIGAWCLVLTLTGCQAAASPSATQTALATQTASELTSPSASLQPGSSGVIYYLSPNLMDEWQAGSKLLIEQGGEALGYEVRTLNANNVASEQANQMDTAISQKP